MIFTPRFTVIHGGQTLLPGSPVVVADKDAEILKEFGDLVPEEKPKVTLPKPPKTPKGKKEQAPLDDDIL